MSNIAVATGSHLEFGERSSELLATGGEDRARKAQKKEEAENEVLKKR